LTGETWNQTRRILTVWRADSIRTEPASHLWTLCGGRWKEHNKETYENGFNELNSNHHAHGRIELQTASLLQLTFVNVLLVRGFISGVGFAQSCGSGVASASRYICGYDSVCCRNRLFCQLDQKSHSSLRHNRLDISGRRIDVSAIRH
jgi:hypothetical protein